jgi:hypothetical protein
MRPDISVVGRKECWSPVSHKAATSEIKWKREGDIDFCGTAGYELNRTDSESHS